MIEQATSIKQQVTAYIMKQNLKYFGILLLLNLVLALQVKSQVYPVQLNTQLIPPYSLRLSDYVTPGTNRVGLNMLLTDLNESGYRVRLELTIEGNGITIKTSPNFNHNQVILDGGVPQYFTSSDLAEWFDPQNLDFSGYSKSSYLATGRLPEGVYRFSFAAYDYNKNIRVSSNIPITAWLMLNEPPLINIPFPNYKVEHIDPQNIVFQWTPRHTASPNSAFTAEYEFTLVEIWPEGRDPNNAMQTSIPIFQTTTTSTTLVYGLAEPFLEPGRKYAYRIQARDVDGRDMFKNNGYTEVRMFTFGDECKPIENVSAKSEKYNTAEIQWTPGFSQTAFTVRYRKANKPDAEWFEQNTFIDNLKLTDLQELTTYEYQVMGFCGTYEGDYSDVQTFTTPAPQVSSFECGGGDNESSISNHDPLPMLRNGDYVWSGSFMFQVNDVTGGNGTFSGKAFAMVPYLSYVKLAAEFTNIKVNTDNQVYEGEIKSIYNPNSPFIFSIDLNGPDYDNTNDSTLTIGGGGLADTTLVTDVDSIYIDGDNIIIVNEDGSIDTIQTTDDIIITDSNGDVWTVDDGIVTVGSGSGPGGGSGTGYLPIVNASDIKIKLEFLPYEKQEYGFDKLTYDVHKPMYKQANVYGENVYLPWKSLAAASMDRVLVKFSDFDTTISPAKVQFRTNNGVALTSFEFEGKKDERLVLMNGGAGKAEEGIEAFVAFKDTSDKNQELVVGKFNTISYEKKNVNIVIVPINGTAGFSVGDFTTALNDIYKQAAISWTVTLQSQFDIEKDEWNKDDDDFLNDGETTLFSCYSDEQNKIIRKYKSDRGIDNESYYVFLLDEINSKTGLAGYMPLKKQVAFIYDGNTDARTIAHELGHGAFRLWHTFSSENTYVMTQNSTDNLMDYNNGQRLHKYQWDFIQDPEAMIAWGQDEEEGALNLSNNVIEAIRIANTSFTEYAKVDKKWKVNEDFPIQLDNAPLLPTTISANILKNDINISSKIYKKEDLDNGTEVMLKFYDQSAQDQIAVTFKLPKEKVGKFLQYLGIVDLIVSGDVITENNQIVALITDDLKMPQISVNINIDPIPDTKLKFTYQIKCNIHYPSYTDSEGKLQEAKYNDNTELKTVESSLTSYTFPFEGILQGGDLIINWNYNNLSGTKTILIRGKNPQLSVIKEYGSKVGSNKYWFIWDLMKRESSNRQFMNIQTINKTTGEKGKYKPLDENKIYDDVTHKSEQVGLPLWGKPKGYGLKQLDNWNGKICNTLQRWNWQENIKGGIEVIERKIIEMKASPKLNQIKSQIIGKEELLEFYDFTVGSTTFSIANSSFFPEWDVKKTLTDSNKSFLDANLINMFNGGHIIQEIQEIKEIIIDEITGKPNEISKFKIIVNTNANYLNDVYNPQN